MDTNLYGLSPKSADTLAPMPATPSTRGGITPGTAAFAAAVGIALLGIALAAFGAWELTVWLLAAALAGAAMARLVLPEDVAGLLRVRRRSVDVLACVLLGTGIVLVFLALPSRP
jgi:hypothetical protein